MSAQENYTSIWVHAANVAEVNNEQGFVECTESVAKKLIEEEKAEDPTIGGFFLTELEDATATVPKKRYVRPPKSESAPVPPAQTPEQPPVPPVVEPVVVPPPVVEQKELVPEPVVPPSKKVYLTK